MEVTPGERRRAAAFYVGSLVAYYGFAAIVALAYGVAANAPVSIALGVLQFVAMTVLTFLVLMYEEDWWNDFRDQNRGLLLGTLGNAAVIAGGITLGQLAL